MRLLLDAVQEVAFSGHCPTIELPDICFDVAKTNSEIITIISLAHKYGVQNVLKCAD